MPSGVSIREILTSVDHLTDDTFVLGDLHVLALELGLFQDGVCVTTQGWP